MDKLRIHCPNCDGKLDVPHNAAGKAARCPVCKAVFRIPKNEKVVADNVADWLTVEEEDDIPPEPGTTPVETKSGAGSDFDDDMDPLAGLDLSIPNPKAEDTMPYPPTAGKSSSKPAEKKTEAPAAAAPKPESKDEFMPGKTQPIHKKPAITLPKINKASSDDLLSLPVLNNNISKIIKCEDLKLYVISVNSSGVTLAFNAHWMRHQPFRASMPLMCIVTGEQNPEELYARPLSWIDKAGGKFINPGEVEAMYEHKIHNHQTTQEIVKELRTIEELPPPFKEPMPYYVSKKVKNETTIKCESISTEQGIGCEVLIPNGEFAVRWLGRVNGVCGEDYIALEEAVLKFAEQGWRDLPENVRQRIASWFDFQTTEQFITYMKDGDFPMSDSGLAGIVLTDKRLVYCKYHHHGEIALDANGHLFAEDAGRFSELKWQNEDKKRKTNVLLKPEEFEMLSQLLQELGCKLQLPLN